VILHVVKTLALMSRFRYRGIGTVWRRFLKRSELWLGCCADRLVLPFGKDLHIHVARGPRACGTRTMIPYDPQQMLHFYDRSC
jgi:hypothetical protein